MSKWVYQADGFSPDEESCVLHETVFHNGNGYIGVRSNFEEGYPEGQKTIRGSYINGFYDFMKMPPGGKTLRLCRGKADHGQCGRYPDNPLKTGQ